MTTKLFSTLCLAVFISIFARTAAKAQTSPTTVAASEITKIKAQEFSRSLAQLKIQEVALERASPVDGKALSLNRAQQNALEKELVSLAVAPLIAERDSLASDLRPEHPRMIALNAEIEKAKASIIGGH